MNAKTIVSGQELRDRMLAGVEKLSESVCSTLGPMGHNVLIQDGNTFHITKDGVTVARSIKLEDPVEQAGARIVQEVAGRTVAVVGDGTTTATALAYAMMNNAKNMEIANVHEFRRGMNSACKDIVKALSEKAIPVGDDMDLVRSVSMISSNGDELVADLITEAVSTVGKDGVMRVIFSKDHNSRVIATRGMQFDAGYMHPKVANNQKDMSYDQNDGVYFLITDEEIRKGNDVRSIVALSMELKKPIVVIAAGYENEALHTVEMNNDRGIGNVCLVKGPGYGGMQREWLEDICIVTGANLISKGSGKTLARWTQDDLGYSESVKVSRDNTKIIGGNSDDAKVKDRAAYVKGLIDNSESEAERDVFRNRYARLSGGVAVVEIGDISESAMRERKDRADDAMYAALSALQEGVLPGGGTALYKVQRYFKSSMAPGYRDDFDKGVGVVYDSISFPIGQIIRNCGLGDDGVTRICETLSNYDDFNFGYDAFDNDFKDLVKSGIVDPMKVTRVALENAVSVTGTILSTMHMIHDTK